MHARSRRDDGQILVIFVIALVAMFAMAGLLFDGGNALVRKRQLQDAGDAAALAASNMIQSGAVHGCSTTAGPPSGAPRPEVVTAALTAVTAALPGFDTSKIVVTCPNVDWAGNYAVQVSLSDHSPGYFGGVVGFSGFGVGTTSQAVNGQVGGLKFSVVELDRSYPTWPNGRQGCPSVQVQGSITVTLEGSMQVDSACPASSGGALDSQGNSATMTFNNGAVIKLVGGYKPGPLLITPAPLTGAGYVGDPLAATLPAIPVASLPVQSSSKLTIGADVVLSPGVYTGGIQMKNTATAYLLPGIYVMNGGGFTIGAKNFVYSVATAAGASLMTDATWPTYCVATSCGVLIFNTGFSNSNSGNTEGFTVGAGAHLKLRPYAPTADPNRALLPDPSAYQNLIFWQNASPVPTSSVQQPIVALGGGGTVDLSGTVYAPSAVVQMGGGAGGSGGGTEVTLQFISWDLYFQGTSNFHFFYQSNAFAKPSDYGLIK